MVRTAGIDLSKGKQVEIGLTYIHGIRRISTNKILAKAGINPDTRAKDLIKKDKTRLYGIIGHSHTVEGSLRHDMVMDIERPTEIGYYRGMRHRKGLPVRGQRSKTSTRTRKGSKYAIANKKK